MHDAGWHETASALLVSGRIAKVGFGLASDHVQIVRTLGVKPQNVLDLNEIFKTEGYIGELGVRGSVALLLSQRSLKSIKGTNWSKQQLTES